MGIRVALNHKTRYRYDRPVRLGPQLVRLRPAPHCRTPISSYSLKVTPRDHFINWQQDPQANYLARLVVPDPTRLFEVEVDLIVDMTAINPFEFFLEPDATGWPFDYDPALARALRPYREVEPLGPALAAFLDATDRTPRRTIDFLVDQNRRLTEALRYVIRPEPGVQSCEETLALASGSCRDMAWLLVQLLRHLGFAARFASGYLIQLTPDLRPLDGPPRPDEDFTDLHAWTEVYLPGAGWVGFDPTSGLAAGEGHIPLACTPEPSSAAPVTGALDPCEVAFSHEMSVARIAEAPRVTKPYTAAQWAAIDALGTKVDGALARGDVRLTMGGEPTFVSVDDMEGAEWTTDALGPTKRRFAGELVRRLWRRHAPGGVVHHGQGKWYPGESLPRWALTVFWRRDGVPVWEHPALLGDEARDYGVGPREAGLFLVTLASRLGIDPALVRAAFEDPWHYVHRECLLPPNVDPLDCKLDDAEERARLARVFERGLGEPVGYALPIARRHEASGPVWLSSVWPLRRDRLILTPGDSAIGYRLPLPSLPWVRTADYPYAVDRDPFEPRPPLPPRDRPQPQLSPDARTPRELQAAAARADALRAATAAAEANLAAAERAAATARPAHGVSAPWVVRTALCVEPRGGRLYVFLPPLGTLEDYLALIAEVEQTAVDLGLPVIFEGYPPPPDDRLHRLSVTPDPGVIEVNIHPSHSWSELVSRTTGLFEDARQSRLGTEKFLIDGRHAGTGGGNHLVLGGPRPVDSPFLRRPDLLRSLITYWQAHPSLSYLFSGLFIGPTSQAPRVDEARHDTLYELEIAFAKIDEAAAGGGPVPPWLIDRILRHLLTDLQGNTHRAEVCIDKLYAPETAQGRLGLIELRAFEMPPHAQMSLVQQLLVRALVARFWASPWRGRLVRWGTELFDRFMLPAVLVRDFQDVLADLAVHGFAFDPAWFTPHIDFRCPVLGQVEHHGIAIELRQALEPWHVMGEEPGTGGPVRYVDSSVERLQVLVRGLDGERYRVVCNGRPVPLHPTGADGEAVGGVRYRAWQPPHCLHPTIPVHTPLVVDLVDDWAGRSIGGCTYHVAHPGGRAFDTFPVNAAEAESRRRARFEPFGHTPGPITVPADARHPDFPVTLDLRRNA